MGGRAFTVCAAASLLACVAVLLLWFGGSRGSVRLGPGSDDFLVLFWSPGRFEVREVKAVHPVTGRYVLSGGPTRLALPMAVPAVIAALVSAAWLATRNPVEAGLRSIAGRCPTCGYDLRATPGRCPECGAGLRTPHP